MDPNDDLWTAIRRVLPSADELGAAVAAELGDPVDDVRLSVLIGTIAMTGQLGPEAAAAAAIEAELGRLQPAKGTGSAGRLIEVDSLADLLAETQALEAKGSLDLETIVAIQRASGAIAARADRPLVVLQHRYAVTRRLLWQRCVDAMHAGKLDPPFLATFGRFLLLWNELTSLAVTDGYRIAERDILARAVESRRGALQELLGVVADDAVSESPTPPRSDATWPEPGPRIPTDCDRAQPRERSDARAAGHRRGGPRAAGRTDRSPARVDRPGRGGRRAGIRLPAVLPLLGRMPSSPARIGPA